MNACIEVLKVMIWPLFLFLSLLLFFLFFKKEISEVIGRVRRVKRGDTEVEVAQRVEGAETAPQKFIEDEAVSRDLLPRERDLPSQAEPKTTGELLNEMMDTLLDGNFEQGEEIFRQLQDAEMDQAKQLRNEGIYLYLRYQRGDTSALEKLRELADKPDIASSAHFWIGLCYEHANDYEKAAEEHELAAQNSKSQKERAELVVSVARSLFKAGKQQAAFARLMKELGEVTVSEAISKLYEGLADLYEMADNQEFQAVAVDKALESKPNDTSLLFDAAYSYSQKQFHSLALLHYKTLLGFRPDNAAALNNIGVAYENLQMPIYSARFYRKAFETNPEYTLAAANLAFRFMNVGFAEEAVDILEKAKQRKEVHPNVGSALSALSNKKEAEANTEKHHLDAAREQQRFLRAFADAYFVSKMNCPSFDGLWKSSGGIQLEITQNGNLIKGKWNEKDKSQEFRGKINNRGATVSIEQRYTQDIDGKAYISIDGKQLFIMTFKGNEHLFVTLNRAG